MTSGIYQIKNIINNKIYVGSAVNIKSRWSAHICNLSKQKHCNNYLQKAWNKYGKDSFSFSIIELVSNLSDLITYEQCWLDKTKCYLPKNGYNICPKAGNTLGNICTDETKVKISKSKLGKLGSNAGKKFTKQHKENISKARLAMFKNNSGLIEKLSQAHLGQKAWNKGIPRTEAVKQAVSCANKGKRLGMRHSKETIEKIRQTHIGKVFSEETKRKMSLAKKGKPSNSPTKFKTGIIPKNKGKTLNKITRHYI